MPLSTPPTAGNDTITVTGSEGVIDLLAGDDILTTSGAVTITDILGGAGNDTIVLDAASTATITGSIDLGANDDSLDAGNAVLSVTNILGGVGSDTIVLDEDDTVTGSVGTGSSITDVNQGFSGDFDSLTLDGATIGGDIIGNIAHDTITLVAGSTNTIGGSIDLGSNNDSLDAGNAVLSVTNILGGVGSDTIVLDEDDTVTGSVGTGSSITDPATGFGPDVDSLTLDGATIGGDIIGNIAQDTITLVAGSTNTIGGSIDLSANNDSLDAGNAVLSVTNILGGVGSDTIVLDEDDTVTGSVGTGNSLTIPNSGTVADVDSVTLDGATIDGDLIGGRGQDTITLVAGSTNTIGGSIDLYDNNDSLDAGNAVLSVTNILGGFGSDTIVLDEDDTVTGSVGTGGSFTTSITGAIANVDSVTLDGATIDGDLIGGRGQDTITLVAGSTNTIGGEVDLGGNDDVMTAGAGSSISVTGVISAGAGADHIDLSLATSAGVTIDGDADNDTILGTSGNDTINGGADTDTVTGGLGDDLFVYTIGENLSILDFGTGSTDADDGDNTNNDFIDLSAFYTNTVELKADLADNGLLDQSDGSDYSDNTNIVGQISDLTALSTQSNSAILEQTGVVCFTRGTRIKAEAADVAIEDLAVGDLVQTLDNGWQPIRWIGSRSVPAVGKLAPVMIKAGVLGNERDLLVSPQHRMLITSWQAELLFGEAEVLATAKSLQNGHNILRKEGGEVVYFHILFDTHEIIFAEGAPSESFHPGEVGMKSFSEATREEIWEIFPELRADLEAFGPTTRVCLKHYEGQTLSAYTGL